MGGRGSLGYGWVIVGTVAAVLMVTSGARFLYGVVLKPIADANGWDRSDLAGPVLLNVVVLSACQPLTGLLADRFGPRRLLVGGTLAIAAMLLPLSRATELWHFYALYGLVGGVAFAAASPVNTTTLVARWFRERRGTALSVALSGTAFGQLVVVPVATWTLTRTDWPTTFRSLSIVLLLMAPLAFVLLREPPGGEVRRDEGAGGAALPGATVGEALRTSTFWLLVYGFLVCGFTMGFANNHFLAYADDMGMHAMTAANVVSVVAVFSVVGTVGLGILADRHRRPPVLALTYALRGVSFGLLFLLPVGPLTFLYGVVLGVSWSATTPLTAAICADLYGSRHLGAIFGTMFTAMNLGFGLGSYLDGLVYDAVGDYELALIANVVIGWTAAFAVLFVGGRRLGDPRRAAPEPAARRGVVASLGD